MIGKRNSKIEMPDMKRYEVDESCREENDEKRENGKKRRTNGCYSVEVTADVDYRKATGSLHSELFGSCEVKVSLEETSREKNRIRPPLLKSARGHLQVLPSRLSNSVLIYPTMKDKSEFTGSYSDGDGKFINDKPHANVELLKKRKIYENGFRGLNVYPSCGKVEEGRFGCAEIQHFETRKCSNFNSSLTSSYDIHSMALVENKVYWPLTDFASESLLSNGKAEKRNELYCSKEELYSSKEKTRESYRPDEFVQGDIVWAKSGKRYPAWPAIVIDPVTQAPKAVLRYFIPGAICVMYFGYSKNGTQRDYAWVKDGMIFPFLQYRERFQLQTKLYTSKPSDFWKAIDEASQAEKGLLGTIDGFGHRASSEANPNVVEEATSSNQDHEGHLNKDTQPCAGCGFTLPSDAIKKLKSLTSESQLLCKLCAKKSKQYCGICKKSWHHSDGGSWVCCDGCSVWVHVKCDKISSKNFKDMEHREYHCPDCKTNFTSERSQSEKGKQEVKLVGNSGQSVQHDKIAVVCNGVDGTYYPDIHLVICNCGSCGTKKQRLSEWERHTGSRAKKWKFSVKVKDSMLPLEKWIAEYDVHGFDSMKSHEHQLLTFLKEPYEPVYAKWTTERCAICRWIEDYEHNKIVVCNRCQLAVHQECYGSSNFKDITSWICKECETPCDERECCLCPVKGGALKPTDVDTLWAHVFCAWFRDEVAFLNEKAMEPAVGILRIPMKSFLKACVICKQTHGSCISCCKCATHYHATCASRAGYHMEIYCAEVNGRQVNQKKSYCAVHRVPNPNNVLVLTSPSGIFAARKRLQDHRQEEVLKGSRPVPPLRIETLETSDLETDEMEPLSAARCRIFRRSKNKRAVEAIFHRPMGHRVHSMDELNSLIPQKLESVETKSFTTFKERLHHLQNTEPYRICFGKSGIHGWGLFARQNIQEGQMVADYRGELLRRSIADRREAQYRLKGKDCYLFTVRADLVLDSTHKGNIARLINHSCSPNCYARIMSVKEDEDRQLVLVAKTNVAAGDELTYDYMFETNEPEELKVPCLCKAPNCRKFMN